VPESDDLNMEAQMQLALSGLTSTCELVTEVLDEALGALVEFAGQAREADNIELAAAMIVKAQGLVRQLQLVAGDG
jgi:hypothetical protein